ncbi:Hypothetical protein, putative [Bodo saltans]|uniref:Uncharacterized protein n=1 Tax=Bodo saltans TaxID=75058 RepID=A0A0S4IU63_BODSA|nr:Hypothetical protein, putative [Bodo saltans]|eukprot:CUF94079.1 Hypothetical protein, putative [Bodo saltans]
MGSSCSSAVSSVDDSSSIHGTTPPSHSIQRPTPSPPPNVLSPSKPEKKSAGTSSQYGHAQKFSDASSCDPPPLPPSHRRLSVSKGPMNNTSNSNIPVAPVAKELDVTPSAPQRQGGEQMESHNSHNRASHNQHHQQKLRNETESPIMATFPPVCISPTAASASYAKQGLGVTGQLASSGSSREGGQVTHNVIVPRNHRAMSDSNKRSVINPLSADRLEDWFRDE